MTPYLFVYGTLMRTDEGRLGRVPRQRLWQEADYVGETIVRGRLYDLGDYPGLVLTRDANSFVYGEVYRLRSPAATLQWLDQYENCSPQGAARGDYVRQIVPIDGLPVGKVRSWVYEFCCRVDHASQIRDGRWCRRAQRMSVS